MSRLKIEVARRQLGTALALYLDDHDPVSVHCLAGGGCELIEHYAKKAGGQPFTSVVLKLQPDLDIKTLRKAQRQFWTAFKHATHQHGGTERDDDKLLSRFTDEQNDIALFIGWWDYAWTTGTMPVEALVHHFWYLALHPDKLGPRPSDQLYEEIFAALPTKSRADQKRMLNEVIEIMRASSNVMSDPFTEARGLMLNWPPEEP